MNKDVVTVSKYLSFILRHKPDSIGLVLDAYGWVSIDQLIKNTTQLSLDREKVELVVETDNKQRFAISDDRQCIRAHQGHSIDIAFDLNPSIPPAVLLHGTAERFWASIQQQGLLKGQRHHVHLSTSSEVAMAVGRRYGKPLLLQIDAKAMVDQGICFFRTGNGVWLVDHVPIGYISIKGMPDA